MTLDKAALDNWIAGAYAPQDECLCPTDCMTCQQEAPGLYCCGRCREDEDDGPDPDDVRDRRIEREMEERDEHTD